MKLQSIERSSIDRGFRKADPLIAKFRGNAQDIPGGRRKGEEHWIGGGGRGIDGERDACRLIGFSKLWPDSARLYCVIRFNVASLPALYSRLCLFFTKAPPPSSQEGVYLSLSSFRFFFVATNDDEYESCVKIYRLFE